MSNLQPIRAWTQPARTVLSQSNRRSSVASRKPSSTALKALDSRQLRFFGVSISREHSSAATPSFFFEQHHHHRTLVGVATASSSSSAPAAATPILGGGTSLDHLFAAGRNLSSNAACPGGNHDNNGKPIVPQQGYGASIALTDGERDLFTLLRRVRKDTHLDTTLRVAGGWVRDKLLATPEFQAYHTVFDVGTKQRRLTSKFKTAASMGRQGTKVLATNEASQPVDIDIALDDMLGREFADHLNEYLVANGEDTVSVGVVLKNPEKSKHLETATMKVGSFWIDFVNLRAEEYTQDSRIPDLMRIGK